MRRKVLSVLMLREYDLRERVNVDLSITTDYLIIISHPLVHSLTNSHSQEHTHLFTHSYQLRLSLSLLAHSIAHSLAHLLTLLITNSLYHSIPHSVTSKHTDFKIHRLANPPATHSYSYRLLLTRSLTH